MRATAASVTPLGRPSVRPRGESRAGRIAEQDRVAAMAREKRRRPEGQRPGDCAEAIAKMARLGWCVPRLSEDPDPARCPEDAGWTE